MPYWLKAWLEVYPTAISLNGIIIPISGIKRLDKTLIPVIGAEDLSISFILPFGLPKPTPFFRYKIKTKREESFKNHKWQKRYFTERI